ncbi:MAG: hypothetical protein LH603_19430 [Pseudonocardia sp.]|nr:hypothetical protein [Pseudonocardia sp.]
MDGGGRRDLVRGTALAALSALLTAVGHVAGGGSLPDAGLLLILVPLVAGLFVSLADLSRSTAGTVVALAAGQLALHELMSLLHPAHDVGPAVLTGPAMPAMHAAVTLAVAVALRHSDHGLSVLIGALRRVLPRRPARPPVDPPLPTFAVPAPDVAPRRARMLDSAHARRGPPVRC